MVNGIIILCIFLVGSGLMILKFRTEEQRLVQWASLASRSGLQLEDEAISGTIDGVRLHVREKVELRRNATNRVSTVFQASTDQVLPRGLELVRVGFAIKAASMLGGGGISIGIPEIDESILIVADSGAMVREWAGNPQVVGALKELAAGDDPFEFDKGLLQITYPGELDIEEVEQRMRRCIRIMAGLGGGASAPSPTQDAPHSS